MPERKRYNVTSTVSTTYLEGGSRVVEGFTVWVNLLDWNEAHSIKVKSLNPTVIDTEVRKLITEREKLDNLG